MYYAKLIKNSSFYFFNRRFLNQKEEQIDESIFKYLSKNKNFKVRKEEQVLL
ncbi:hypothetical protein II5_06005 [Bacillus cereus MSX-A1]|uniref:YqbF domain-containing protein n=1 Tax=Bacillus cereus TaxID=1396 RepID=UPI000279540F|nr:YqbF domain-containing protein [Bacillus cereus]EJQ97275.1 hypothetical protein II5_06005 [Bacillus cereus MSX-A1]MDR4292619.1 hypothetical protein [Bacillus cereus]